MAGHRHRGPQFSAIIDGSWSLFPVEETNPWTSPLPADHPLVTFLDRALSPTGLTPEDFIAIGDDPFRQWATVLRTFHMRSRVARATQQATPELLESMRREGLHALASLTDEEQRKPNSILAQYLREMDRTAVVLPGNGRRAFRKAFKELTAAKQAPQTPGGLQ